MFISRPKSSVINLWHSYDNMKQNVLALTWLIEQILVNN